jgi:hypothetical protein
MKAHHVKHNSEDKPDGKIVSVTYKLKKSAFVAFLNNGFSIGYVNIDLLSDQETEPNSFSTREGKFYPCLMQEGGLQVTVFAEGKSGDFWNLELEIDGKALAANPIRVETDHQGHLDFNQLIV